MYTDPAYLEKTNMLSNTSFDSCAEEPCQHNSTCTELNGRAWCTCPVQNTGQYLALYSLLLFWLVQTLEVCLNSSSSPFSRSCSLLSFIRSFWFFSWYFLLWGPADVEIKALSVENTELRGSPVQAWSRSVYSHTCYAYCQGFLPF